MNEGAGEKLRVRDLLKRVSVSFRKLVSLEEVRSKLAEVFSLLDCALRDLGVYEFGLI